MKTGKDGISDIISVFNMYEQKMYHIAYAILHDSYQAEDAVMDAFVRLLLHCAILVTLVVRYARQVSLARLGAGFWSALLTS